MDTKKLTDRERAFLAAWKGNATQAVIDAGIVPADNRRYASVAGAKLRKKLSGMITQLTAEREARAQISSDEVLRWWADRMRDPEEKTEIRVKCSELIGRALGMFIERRELTGTLTVAGLQAELEARRHGG